MAQTQGKRIHLFGASGSGCSSLGRYMAAALHVHFFDTDDFYREKTEPPFVQRRLPLERKVSLEQSLRHCDAYVLAGEMSSWKERAPPEFTLVVFVRTPKQRRYTRLLARERERYGDRVAPGGDLHAISSAFLAWCAAYDDGEQPAAHCPDTWPTTRPCQDRS